MKTKVFLLRYYYASQKISEIASWPISEHKDVAIFSSKEAAKKFIKCQGWRLDKGGKLPYAEIIEFGLL
jgi:hypothetical protein